MSIRLTLKPRRFFFSSNFVRLALVTIKGYLLACLFYLQPLFKTFLRAFIVIEWWCFDACQTGSGAERLCHHVDNKELCYRMLRFSLTESFSRYHYQMVTCTNIRAIIMTTAPEMNDTQGEHPPLQLVIHCNYFK